MHTNTLTDTDTQIYKHTDTHAYTFEYINICTRKYMSKEQTHIHEQTHTNACTDTNALTHSRCSRAGSSAHTHTHQVTNCNF